MLLALSPTVTFSTTFWGYLIFICNGIWMLNKLSWHMKDCSNLIIFKTSVGYMCHVDKGVCESRLCLKGLDLV